MVTTHGVVRSIDGKTEVPRRGTLLVPTAIGLAWVEARPSVQIIFQLRILAVVAVASLDPRAVPDLVGVAICCAGWLCVTWSIYLLNGITDRAGDRLNGGTRPIASGALGVDTARVLVVVLSSTGLSLCLVGDELTFVAAATMLILGYLYSAGPAPLKRSVWGVQVSVIGGGLLTYSAAVAAADLTFSAAGVLFATALSAWMGVGGISKDVSDVEGDRRMGRRTLAMWSERGSLHVAAAAAMVVSIGFSIGVLTEAPELIVPALMLVVGACAFVRCALVPGLSSRNPRTAYRTFMLTQYGTHAAAICISV